MGVSGGRSSPRVSSKGVYRMAGNMPGEEKSGESEPRDQLHGKSGGLARVMSGKLGEEKLPWALRSLLAQFRPLLGTRGCPPGDPLYPAHCPALIAPV